MTIESLYELVLIMAEFEKSIDARTNSIEADAESTNVTDEILEPVYVTQAHQCIFTHLQGHPHNGFLVFTVSSNERQNTYIFDLVKALDDIQCFDAFYSIGKLSLHLVGQSYIFSHLEDFQGGIMF